MEHLREADIESSNGLREREVLNTRHLHTHLHTHWNTQLHTHRYTHTTALQYYLRTHSFTHTYAHTECVWERERLGERERARKAEEGVCCSHIIVGGRLGSISSIFHEQLLHAQILKAQKDWQLDCIFCAFGICLGKSFA